MTSEASLLAILGPRLTRRTDIQTWNGEAAGEVDGFVVDRDEVERALDRLSADHRAIVVVHFFLGLPLPDAAAALGIPLGTAKSRLHRSLAAMRADLGLASSLEAAKLPGGQVA